MIKGYKLVFKCFHIIKNYFQPEKMSLTSGLLIMLGKWMLNYKLKCLKSSTLFKS